MASRRHGGERETLPVCQKVGVAQFAALWSAVMKINENTLLEGQTVVLVPYNADHVPR